MKIYLAAQFDRMEEVEDRADTLRWWGHDTTSRWHTGIESNVMLDRAVQGELAGQKFAKMDVDDVEAADAIIGFTEQPGASDAASVRGGRHIEFGYARRADKLLYVVGPRENIFHTLPGIRHFPEWTPNIMWALANDWSWLGLRRGDTPWICRVCDMRGEGYNPYYQDAHMLQLHLRICAVPFSAEDYITPDTGEEI